MGHNLSIMGKIFEALLQSIMSNSKSIIGSSLFKTHAFMININKIELITK